MRYKLAVPKIGVGIGVNVNVGVGVGVRVGFGVGVGFFASENGTAKNIKKENNSIKTMDLFIFTDNL